MKSIVLWTDPNTICTIFHFVLEAERKLIPQIDSVHALCQLRSEGVGPLGISLYNPGGLRPLPALLYYIIQNTYTLFIVYKTQKVGFRKRQ